MSDQLSLVELGRVLESLGYHVSEHPAFGGVQKGAHSTNSWHYRASGTTRGALDVNVAPPGDHPRERVMLEELWEALIGASGSLEQLIYRGRGYFGGNRGSKWGSYGHPTHLHLAASGPIVGFEGVAGHGGRSSDGARRSSAGGGAIGVLRRGSSGPDVGWWQRSLLRHDADALAGSGIDHDFGKLTEAATRAIQEHLDVTVDGVVGPATLASFRAHVVTKGHPHNAPEEPSPPAWTDDAPIGVLRRGETGPDVRWWQRGLQRHDARALPGAGVDGDFGPGTEEATRAVQTHLDVAVDGIVGPGTLAAFRSHVAESGHPHGAAKGAGAPPAGVGDTPAVVLRRGDDGDDVEWWQRALRRHDAAALPAAGIDGDFGTGTEAATTAVQAHLGVTVDGVVGPVTIAAFRRHLEGPGHPHEAPATTGGTSAPGRSPRALSDAGAAFIGVFEGFRSELYEDAAGHCTIGYGHLVHHGRIDGSEPAEFKRGISEQRAREILRDDAATAAAAVIEYIDVPLNQAQFDALVSFTFNLGTGSLRGSTLRRKLNEGNYGAVPSELLRWNKAGGRVLRGLTRRREAEGRLFSRGAYQ